MRISDWISDVCSSDLSYLTYLRDRLMVARDLLTESGSIFVQIGDENVHRVRAVMDEVFGEENFVSTIAYAKTKGFSGDTLSNVADYMVWYAKRRQTLKYRELFTAKQAGEAGATKYRELASIRTFNNNADRKRDVMGNRVSIRVAIG